MKTNLAFVIDEPLELEESILERTLDPVTLDELLRLGSGNAGNRSRTRAARGRRVLVSFKDNHSDLFKPFRIY